MTTLGIIGGTGQLGSAMATAWLETRTVTPGHLWFANSTGALGPLARWEGVRGTPDAQAMVEACDVVILSVPPAAASNLKIATGDRLVISVMAGVTLDRLADITRGTKLVRAMSSPAAAQRLAYSPWIAAPGLGADDTATVAKLLTACGLTDRVTSEDQIDRFTAITGPVPGFVAAFADAVVSHAAARGVPADIAVRATRQLFLAAGTAMALDDRAPRAHVDEMIDYAGTTAAGLLALDQGPLKAAVDQALDAAYQRTKTIG
ncbi:MAG: pyrroline-5-carboxylate reductase dimerization domain-containing protein [Pseudomonadota bacterium]